MDQSLVVRVGGQRLARSGQVIKSHLGQHAFATVVIDDPANLAAQIMPHLTPHPKPSLEFNLSALSLIGQSLPDDGELPCTGVNEVPAMLDRLQRRALGFMLANLANANVAKRNGSARSLIGCEAIVGPALIVQLVRAENVQLAPALSAAIPARPAPPPRPTTPFTPRRRYRASRQPLPVG